MQGHVYSPDFSIAWAEKARKIFFNVCGSKVDLYKSPFITDIFYSHISIIEVKPVFDQNNMTRLFTINQKWMYQLHGVYVQKVVPVKLFEKTFTPKKYLLTDKSGKPRKLKYKPTSLEEFLCQQTKK